MAVAEEGVSTVVAAVDASVATVVIAPTTAVIVRTGNWQLLAAWRLHNEAAELDELGASIELTIVAVG